MRLLLPHLRGHALRFEAKKRPAWPSSAGIRLLLIFALLEGIIGPRLWLFTALGIPVPPPWVRVPLLLALALILIRFFAGLTFPQIGLHRWRDWTTIEKSYFVQVLIAVNIVFPLLFARRLQMITAQSLLPRAATVMITYLVWGFYQELMYRGVLQTELVRRWGTVAGIVVSNVLFTFGPLHFYHFADRSPLPMFFWIFGIGLFFGVLLKRSGNLWIPAVFHGVGDAYFTGLPNVI